jgi:transcriptional regulator with XRE-family HTH domain
VIEAEQSPQDLKAKKVPRRRTSTVRQAATKKTDSQVGAISPAVGVLARKSRSLRIAAGLTLTELSARSGISQSALSKIENGQLSPTYEKILALSKGLGVDVAELFNDSPTGGPVGRREVTLKGQGVTHSSAQYDYEVLCSGLSGKQFLPLLTTIKAHSVQDFPVLPRHEGEEFVFVVTGEITLHTEFYEPLRLAQGDSCYFDSNMKHGLVSASNQDAVVLWVCSRAVTLNAQGGAKDPN